MTLLHAVAGFAVVAGLLTIIPGLDTALVLRTAISHGRRAAFATAFGVGTGALLWGAGAAVGVSALLTASTTAYLVVRIVGASYLVYLGVKLIRSALRDRHDLDSGGGSSPLPMPLKRAWWRGLLTNALNPKIGAFYVAVLPQFIPPHSSHLAVGLLLAIVHDVEGMLWFTALILAAQSARRWLAGRRARRAIDATTGAALIGFGVKLGTNAH